MEKQGRLEIAKWAIDSVAPVVRAKGTHHPDTAMATQRAACRASDAPSTTAVAPNRPLRFTVALAWCVRSTRQPCPLASIHR